MASAFNDSLAYVIRYFAPYTWDWRLQSFTTAEEADRMIAFYKECGSPAELVAWPSVEAG